MPHQLPGLLARWGKSRPAQLLWLLILLGVAVRFYRIAGPFPDWHQYRQFDTAALARNLSEDSLNLFYPQVDWGGGSPGYVEVEFQAYTFLVAVAYRLFGVHEYLGRVLNFFFYAATAVLLFRVVCRIFADRRVGFVAVGFYSFLPLSFTVSRNFQPDTLMVLSTLAAIYYFWIWTEEQRLLPLAASAVTLALAVLIKPFCLYVGLPLLYLCWRRLGWRSVTRPILWVYTVVIIVPMAAWYLHAFHLWTLYGNTFGIFGGRVKGLYLGGDTVSAADVVKRVFHVILWEIATPPGFLLLIAGLFLRPPSNNYLLHWWAVSFLMTIPMLPAGHYGHNYYQLPLVLIASPMMAYALVRALDRRIISWRGASIVFLVMAACGAWTLRPMIASSEELITRIRFGRRVGQLVASDALVVFSYPLNYKPSWYSHRNADGELIAGDPTDFYNSHRKGWSLFSWQTSPEMLQKLANSNARYFATFYPKYLYQDMPSVKTFLETHAVPVEVTGRYVIYDLRPATQAGPSSTDPNTQGASTPVDRLPLQKQGKHVGSGRPHEDSHRDLS
jgi:hypothetical protein